MPGTIMKTGNSRVWLAPDGSGPSYTYRYLGRARADSIDFNLGNITPVREPSRDRYGQYEVIDTIRGAPDLPQMSIEQYLQPVVSEFLRIANKGCAVDLQIHFGDCQRPDDFREWTIVRVLEEAQPQTFSTGPQGAMQPDDEATVLETLNLAARRLYDIKQIRPEEQAAAQVTDHIVDVVICDSATCGECGIASDGCQVVLTIQGPTTGSPGLPAEVVYTQDGGATFGETSITTLALAEAPSGAACVGSFLVIASNDSGSLHIARIADILAGTETWTEVTTGFEVGGEPNAIYSAGAGMTWVVGDGGHIYFTGNVEQDVTVQQSGGITAQNLTAIHGMDEREIVAVGESNVVLSTRNGGATWTLIVGPAVGVNLTTVWMREPRQWFVGTAGGQLWYTQDGGTNWTEVTFSGSGAGVVRDVEFASRNVGYMAHDTATPAGRILRTIDGGQSWYVLPEEQGQSIPANDEITAIAVCREDVNLVWGGGIADNATDGFLVKFA